MGVRVEFPSVLAKEIGDRRVELEPVPRTLAEAIKELFYRYPALKEEMLGPDGEIDYSYRFFLNGMDVSPWRDRDLLLRDGDELVILLMLAGG
jgi:ferredoxin-nitrite reductase